MANSNLYLFGIGSDGEPAELPVPAEAATVHDALAGLPAGVYSTIRTFGGNRFLGLGAHVDRLESSMRGIGIADPLDREALLTVLDGLGQPIFERLETVTVVSHGGSVDSRQVTLKAQLRR